MLCLFQWSSDLSKKKVKKNGKEEKETNHFFQFLRNWCVEGHYILGLCLIAWPGWLNLMSYPGSGATSGASWWSHLAWYFRQWLLAAPSLISAPDRMCTHRWWWRSRWRSGSSLSWRERWRIGHCWSCRWWWRAPHSSRSWTSTAFFQVAASWSMERCPTCTRLWTPLNRSLPNRVLSWSNFLWYLSPQLSASSRHL